MKRGTALGKNGKFAKVVITFSKNIFEKVKIFSVA